MCIVIPVLLVSVLCGLPYTFPRETIVTEPDQISDMTGAYIVPGPRYFPPSGAQFLLYEIIILQNDVSIT